MVFILILYRLMRNLPPKTITEKSKYLEKAHL
jgi:hypothetical protein